MKNVAVDWQEIPDPRTEMLNSPTQVFSQSFIQARVSGEEPVGAESSEPDCYAEEIMTTWTCSNDKLWAGFSSFDALLYTTQLDYVHKNNNRMLTVCHGCPTEPIKPHPELRFDMNH